MTRAATEAACQTVGHVNQAREYHGVDLEIITAAITLAQRAAPLVEQRLQLAIAICSAQQDP
jgi:hypothetical protein